MDREPTESHARVDRIVKNLSPTDETSGLPVSLTSRMEELHVPAVSVAVGFGDETSWSACFGKLARDEVGAATPGTLFEIGSVTKMVTAVTALCLVEREQLALDADIHDVLHSWRLPDSALSSTEKVTLRRLLTHTSGLPSTLFDVEEDGVPTTAQVLRGERPAINEPAVLASIPGTDHAYSNLAYVVIQQMIEDITGHAFPAVVREVLLEPLGMTHSTFDPLGEGVSLSELPRPHDAEGTAHPIAYHPTAVAQGGMWTTPSELLRLLGELIGTLNDRETGILSPAMVDQMVRPQPALDGSQYGWTDGQGLGVFLLGRGEQMRFLHPGLNVPGATGLAIAWPSKRFAVAIATNGFNGQTLQLELLRSISTEYGVDLGL